MPVVSVEEGHLFEQSQSPGHRASGQAFRLAGGVAVLPDHVLAHAGHGGPNWRAFSAGVCKCVWETGFAHLVVWKGRAGSGASRPPTCEGGGQSGLPAARSGRLHAFGHCRGRLARFRHDLCPPVDQVLVAGG